MDRKPLSMFVSSLMLACAVGQSPAAGTEAGTKTTLISSTGANGKSTAQAVMKGQNGVISLNGDRIEVRDGKLSFNGVSYGTVSPQATIKYVVKGGDKKLLVDGIERHPS